jgi:hypothetical protein
MSAPTQRAVKPVRLLNLVQMTVTGITIALLIVDAKMEPFLTKLSMHVSPKSNAPFQSEHQPEQSLQPNQRPRVPEIWFLMNVLIHLALQHVTIPNQNAIVIMNVFRLVRVEREC